MKDHYCPESGCLYCMVIDLYAKIDNLSIDNLRLARENLQLTRAGKQLQDALKKQIAKGKK